MLKDLLKARLCCASYFRWRNEGASVFCITADGDTARCYLKWRTREPLRLLDRLSSDRVESVKVVGGNSLPVAVAVSKTIHYPLLTV